MPKKILIIDDEPDVVTYLTSILGDEGYQVCSACGVKEGMEMLAQEQPDLITLDLEMPREWGPRFYQKMRKSAEFRDLPVIVISGISGPRRAIKNAVDTILKPFEPETVLEAVRKAIGPV